MLSLPPHSGFAYVNWGIAAVLVVLLVVIILPCRSGGELYTPRGTTGTPVPVVATRQL